MILAKSITLREAVQGPGKGAPNAAQFHVVSVEHPAALLRPEYRVARIELGDVFVTLINERGDVRITPVSNLRDAEPEETKKPQRGKDAA